MSKKDKLIKIKYQKHNKKSNRKKALNNQLKSENKELRYELSENLENLKEQATRLQRCIAENGTLKKVLLLQSKN